MASNARSCGWLDHERDPIAPACFCQAPADGVRIGNPGGHSNFGSKNRNTVAELTDIGSVRETPLNLGVEALVRNLRTEAESGIPPLLWTMVETEPISVQSAKFEIPNHVHVKGDSGNYF